MRAPTRWVAALAAVLAVSMTLAGNSPAPSAFASDPLQDAYDLQQQLQDTLSKQRAELAALKELSATLSQRLEAAIAELTRITAEYERVAGLLVQVRDQIDEVQARLDDLRVQIKALDHSLLLLAIAILKQKEDLAEREALLQDHLRAAYESSQTSLLEILLSATSLDEVTNQVGYLLTVADQDRALADSINQRRLDLVRNQSALRSGRLQVAIVRDEEQAQAELLAAREAELADIEHQLAKLKAEAQRQRAEQEAALNAALEAQGDVQAKIKANEKAEKAAAALIAKILAERSGTPISSRGFRWPEDVFRVTQEWGPTSFYLEPAYTYNGTYYRHFHTAIDLAHGCGTRIYAAGSGTVVASGQALYPWDYGYGVFIDHGGGVVTMYWHMTTTVVVHRGQSVTIGQLIGYEGRTGIATGCHVHFGVNDHGVWQNPRWYLP